MNNQKIFLLFLQISIISCAISVSISQLFLGLTLILFLFDKERRNRIILSNFIIIIILFFSLYLISFIWNFLRLSPDINFFLHLKQSEFKDILLFLGFFLTSTLGKDEREKIQFSFIVLCSILAITGFFSIFSPYRFSYLINSLFRSVSSWKFQHHYGSISGLDLFLPIGLMNTHLTFGGLLGFFSPFIFFSFIDSMRSRKSIFIIVLEMISVIIYFSVVLLNNARSSIFGSMLSIIFGLILGIYVKKEYSIKILSKYIGIPFFISVVILSGLSFTEPFKKTILPLFGSQKHTDSGRTFIWDSTFSIIEKHPILGIGPGNYPLEIDFARKEKSEKYPDLLFFYEVTQRGHAHNDYFHIATISGIPNSFIYLLICFFILKKIIHLSERGEKTSLFYGLLGFFFAGCFQCYFQDDEVVIVFWYLCGFLFSYLTESSSDLFNRKKIHPNEKIS